MAETKYIFVTGGVCSSLGKGVISASIGKLLQARGYNIGHQKFDPYVNVSAGNLNPQEHGECYVTIDGHEADLDLGHYERFTGVQTTKLSDLTSGSIYQSVIDKERRGDYLGKTVQIIPHITEEIKRNVRLLGAKGNYDFLITEIGGTVGDIEGLPFLEAIRQIKWEFEGRALFVHLAYVPYLAAAGELKTKPAQHSVKSLQSLGIQPDVLVLRTEHDLSQNLRNKVASFCNIDKDCVVQSLDLPSIYFVPLAMQAQGLDAAILRKFNLPVGETPGLGPWRSFLDRREKATEELNIALIGKYDLQDAYKSILESLSQAGTYNDRKVKTHFINSEKINKDNVAEKLAGMDAYLICPGEGHRGMDGKIIAAQYCRENNKVTLGIHVGMQLMCVDFARNVLGLTEAHSRMLDESTPQNVIDIMLDAKATYNQGNTLRLGGYECQLAEGSKVREIYGTDKVVERHRHRYEFNNAYKEEFEKAGMAFTGVNPESGLVEIVEVPANKWYIGVQFHPEYQSTVLKPHPLFLSFIKAAIEQ